MIYRVPIRDSYGEQCGYTFHTNKKDALKAWKSQMLEKCEETGKTLCNATEWYRYSDSKHWEKGVGFDPFSDALPLDGIKSMPTPKNKADLLYMLREWAAHPYN